jgi:hypothetical protein
LPLGQNGLFWRLFGGNPMRTAIASLMLAAALAVGYVISTPPAQCGWFKWCSPVICYSSGQCNAGCTCMSPGPKGQCVSFD